MSAAQDLGRLRDELDQVDRQLVELVARRLQIVGDVGKAKAESASPVRDVPRERAVLDRVVALAEERGVAGELVRRIFREIIGHAVDRQVAELTGTSERPLVVAFQGAEHAYSHLAAQKHMAGRGRSRPTPARSPSPTPSRPCWRGGATWRSSRSRTRRRAASTRSTTSCRPATSTSWARRPGGSTTAWPRCATSPSRA
jgi:chorismate mutase